MSLTKKQVDKAGDTLRLTPSSEEALDTLAAWRNMHAYPLRLAFNLLKRKTDAIGNHALYGQRLKRVSSIVHKLERMPKTNLSRMQDIGGCRVILSNYEKLRSLYSKLKTSKSILDGHKDYITYPKSDGYRGIHLIYRCDTRKEQFNGLKIEYQLRTKLQHAWATAVEIIDSFEGQNLKLGKGTTQWRRFFYLVADEFAKMESLPLHDNSIIIDRVAEIKKLSTELNVIDKLQSYTFASKKTTAKDTPKYLHVKSANYFILTLNIQQVRLYIRPFVEFQDAQAFYLSQEKEYLGNPLINVLLVKSDNIKQLKQSYPNYFVDSRIFLERLETIISKS